MCRYAAPYKEHYACFTCRKVFKQPPTSDLPRSLVRDGDRTVVCPQCRSPMHDLGRDFKAPTQRNIKQWNKVECLYERGITFHSCGCSGPGPRPAKLRDIEPFLTEQQQLALERARTEARITRADELEQKRRHRVLKRVKKRRLR